MHCVEELSLKLHYDYGGVLSHVPSTVPQLKYF